MQKCAIGLSTAAIMALISGAASGQVVISEIYENPPGSGSSNDAVLEYIELYGFPGTDLTGYAIGLFKGGTDPDGDDIPDEIAEIDEAFSLDGLSIGSNGFLVIYNGTPAQSLIPIFLPGEGENSASFFDTHIPSSDTNGNLSNDGSSTYLLVRARPNHRIENGVSVYEPGYSIRKEPNPDANFDGKLDFGFETMSAVEIDPLQIIDEIAWSNGGGKEYVRSSDQEISDTPDFNPDAVSRVSYFGTNPMLGLRMNSEGETVPTRSADEEFIYGDMQGASTDFRYDPTRSGAPTDPNGDGFQDISIEAGGEAFVMTPGTFNDHGPTGITQFRFVMGDLNFDGVVDAEDLALFDDEGLLDADFDLTTDLLDDMGSPIPNPEGGNLQTFVFEGRLANAYLAARNLDLTDGVGGMNADVPTSADRDVLAGMVGPQPCNDADFASPFGDLDFFDVQAFLALFSAMDLDADLTDDGMLDFFDVQEFLSVFSAGCP